MIPSWLRRLFDNRFKGAARRPRRWPARPQVEVLETRTMPTTVTWTGNDVPLGGTRWSDPGNWFLGVTPQNNDDVIFPDSVPDDNKINDVNGEIESPPDTLDGTGEPFNSFNDIGGLSLNTLTIGAKDFIIGGNPITLRGDLNASSTFGSGVSLINFNITLLGNPQKINVVSHDATLILNSSLSQPGGDTAVLSKQGQGTLVLSNEINDYVDLFTDNENPPDDPFDLETSNSSISGVINVQAGTLEVLQNSALGSRMDQPVIVFDGATLRVSGTTISSDAALQLTGNGQDGKGALLGGPARFLQDGAKNRSLRFLEDFQGDFGLPHVAAWNGPITLSPSAAIGVVDGGHGQTLPPVEVTLTLPGGISGAGDLTKVGGGTLILSTIDNTYGGKTDIKAGVLSARVDGALAEGSSTTVETGATLDIHGVLTIDEPIFLNGDGAKDFTGSFLGALESTGGADNPPTDAILTGSVTLLTASSIGGDNNSTLTISGPLTGSGDLRKIGLSTLVLPNANPGFTGNTIIGNNFTGGTLIIKNAQALGPPPTAGGSITVNNSGSLQLQGSFNIGKPLILNGFGFNSAGALQLVGGSSTDDTWSGTITIGSSTSIFTDAATQLRVTGVIDGGSGASLEKFGAGKFVLDGANTYLGRTTLRDGTTIITANRSLGGAGGGGTAVAAGATLQLGGGLNLPSDEDLTLTGSGDPNVPALHVTFVPGGTNSNSVGGIVNLAKPSTSNIPVLVTTDGAAQMIFSNVVSGSAQLEKGGTGTLFLSGNQANTATGGAMVDAGTLVLNKSANTLALIGDVIVGDGVGGVDADVLRLLNPNQIADSSNVTVNKSGLFDLNNKNEKINGLTLTAGDVKTGSDGTLTLGASVTTKTANNGQSSHISGNLSLGAATRTFTVAQDLAGIDDLIVDAIISGTNTSAGLVKDGPGTMRLNAANTYTGKTTVNGGTLKLGVNNALVTSSVLSIGSSGTFDLNNHNQTVAELSGAGTLALGTGTFTDGDATSTTFSGTLSGSGKFIKVGTSTLTLMGDSSSTFSGATDIRAGKLQVDGKLGSGVVTVEAGTTLQGKGTVGGISDKGGTVSPGDSAGKLTSTGDVSFDGNSTFRVEINGTDAGITYDQLSVTGAATLGGAKLVTSFGSSYKGAVGDSYTILHTTAGVSGLFKDSSGKTLNDLDTFVDNGRVFQIDYTGTDVNITLVAFVSTVSLSSSQNPSTIGQAVTFTATIGTPVSGAPDRTGTVTFFDGSTQLGDPVDVSNNQAKFTTSTLPGGTRAINAVYSGDSNFQGSSGVLNPPQVVKKINSSTTLTSDINPVDYGQTFTFTATVAASSGSGPVPTGDVTFVDTTTGKTLGVRTLDNSGQAKLTVDGSSVAFLDAGLHTVKASFPGDNSYNASSGSFTETVNQVSTSTSVSASQSSSLYGEPVTYTATVTSSTTTPFGSVTFTADDGAGHVTTMGTKSLDSNGQAALSFNALPVGTFTITAAFNANIDFKASSGTTSETVSQGTTSSSLSTSKSPTVFGEPVTFTATVSPNAPSTLPPKGSVTFIDTTTSTTLGTSNLDNTGKAKLTVTSLSSSASGMTHTIEATYNTDGNYASSSATVDQTVNPAPTKTTVTTSPNPSVYSQVVTITATVNPSPSVATPTGSVVFTIDGNQSSPVGLNGSGKAQLKMTFTTLGSHTISAAYTSNNTDKFLSSSSSQVTQQVNAAPTAVSLASSPNPSQLGGPVTFTATVSAPASTATPTGSVTFVIDGSSQATVGVDSGGHASFTTSSLAAGPHTVVAQFNTNSSNFVSSSSAPLQQLVKKNYFVTGAGAGKGGEVRVFDATTGAIVADGVVYPGGVNEAVGDIDGDGIADFVFAPASGPGALLMFNGKDLSFMGAFAPYGNGYTAGVFVAIGDLNGDGHGEIITGVGGLAPAGLPQVQVFGLGFPVGFNVYDPSFGGGVRVATGDLEAAGRADLVTAPGPGTVGGAAPPLVLVSLRFGIVPLFPAYGAGNTAGAFVALGDINGDGHADIITGMGGGSTQVNVLSGTTLGLIQSFQAYPGSPQGVEVGAVDRNGDGRADILTMPALGAPPGGRIIDGLTLTDLDAFFFFAGTPQGAASVAGSL